MENPSLKHNTCLRPMNTHGMTRSVNIKLALTEENLDYLLRQEYTLSQMCYKADQLTLDILDGRESVQSLKDPKQICAAEKEDQISIVDISDDQMDVEQDGEYSVDRNKADPLEIFTMKPERHFEINNSDYISLHNVCPLYEVKRKMIEHKFKKRAKNNSIGTLVRRESDDKKFTTNLPGKNAIVFKTLNLINISRALKNHKTLYLNCNINDILQVKNSLRTFSCLKLCGNETCGKKIKEITFPYNISTGMFQNLICLIESLFLKEYADLNESDKKEDSDHSSVERDRNNDSSSFEDLALMIAPSQSTIILNSDTFNSDISAPDVACCDIYSEMFNVPTTLNASGRIEELNALDYNINSILPVKSNLKRDVPAGMDHNQNNIKKSSLRFSNITTFYFERLQGFSSIPTKGGCTLGMANHHFYISTVPVDEYEYKKLQGALRKRRTNNIFYREIEAQEKPKRVQALNLNQRVELLVSAEVQIELREADDCAYIRSSRASAGCDCKDYCDPDVCSCNLAGIQCQIDSPNFPCGCSKENCRNAMGCTEYNYGKVKAHFTRTMKKIKLEKQGRISKRKQASPSKILIHSLEKDADIDMIDI